MMNPSSESCDAERIEKNEDNLEFEKNNTLLTIPRWKANASYDCKFEVYKIEWPALEMFIKCFLEISVEQGWDPGEESGGVIPVRRGR